jgi:hypothetical protein
MSRVMRQEKILKNQDVENRIAQSIKQKAPKWKL